MRKMANKTLNEIVVKSTSYKGKYSTLKVQLLKNEDTISIIFTCPLLDLNSLLFLCSPALFRIITCIFNNCVRYEILLENFAINSLTLLIML